MKIAVIQFEISDQDGKSQAIARVEKLIDRISDADLIMLPEIWNIGYFSFDKYIAESENENGETINRMQNKAKEKNAYILTGSIIEKDNNSFFNTTFMISPSGEIVGKYRKMHLLGYHSKESEILSRGQNICVIKTQIGTFGLSTCYDLRFPELFRQLIDNGAETILTVSAWPYPRLEHWMLFNRVRAIENQAFLISSNCVGINNSVQYCGHSMVVDPWGTIVTSGGDEQCILKTEISLDKVSELRRTFPIMKDRVLG